MIEYSYFDLFNKFKIYLKPYSIRLIFGTILRFISAILNLYNAYALAFIVTFITKYQTGDSFDPLYITFTIWPMVYLVRHTLIYYAKMLCITVGEQVALNIEKGAMKHMSLIDISWHEKENAGNKVKRIQRGADGLTTIIRVWIVNIIDITVNFVGVFIIISRFDYTLAFLVMFYLIIQFSVSSRLRRQTVAISKIKNIKDEESSGLMYEIINNIRSVKVLDMADPLLNFVQKVNAELMVLIKRNLFWYHISVFFRTTWQSIGRVALLGFVIYGIFHGKYELGFFILFYGYFNTISTSIDDLSNVTQDVALAKANLSRLLELLNEKINIDSEVGKLDFPNNWDSIKINNLTFGYGNNKVLDNVSFEIKKGEKVGIAGLSGAGKSTLFKLLLKEHESLDDHILIGNVSLKQIKRTEYIKHVATVLQDTEVFNLSLKDNILISNYSEKDNYRVFDRAINISHVDDFINKLPNGVGTLIGEKGVKLSGGERQRLGIARAIFKNPEILFLDEATSHLDVESEQKIQDSLKHFFGNVTAIVIAHRLSTIKEMDKIIVLEDGKILEIGSFNELYEKDGRFREFWDKQKI